MPFSAHNTPALNFVCGSAVFPMRFVKVSSATAYQCLQTSSATDQIIGISQEASRFPPTPTATTEAGDLGDPIYAYGVGQTAYLTLGSGGAVQGNLLTSDANGNGIVASGSNVYGGVAEQSGNSGDFIRVTILIGVL